MPLKTDQIQIFTQHIKDCPDNPEQFLTSEDSDRLLKISSTKSRLQFLNAHTLLNRILADILLISPQDLIFFRNSHGKPFLNEPLLPVPESGILFSVSHSHDLAAVAIARNIELGIDIEKKHSRGLKRCLQLARRFYHSEEISYLQSFSADEDKIKNFFKIWTLKESYLKATGTGINIQLNTLNFHPQSGSAILSINSTPQNDYSFYHTEIDEHTISLAYHKTVGRTVDISVTSQ